jgi:hypothetical protein
MSIETGGLHVDNRSFPLCFSLAEVLEQALPRCHELSGDQKVRRSLALAFSSSHRTYQRHTRRQRALDKTARSVELRAKSLSSVDGERDAPSKDDMENILAGATTQLLVHAVEILLRSHFLNGNRRTALRGLFASDEPPVFPLDLPASRAAPQSSTVQVVEADDDELDEFAENAAAATTKTPLRRAGDAKYLDLDIMRVGLKDAKAYVNPTIVVSVYGSDGKRLEEPIETSVGVCNEPQHIAFRKTTVQLETSLARMEERTCLSLHRQGREIPNVRILPRVEQAARPCSWKCTTTSQRSAKSRVAAGRCSSWTR